MGRTTCGRWISACSYPTGPSCESDDKRPLFGQMAAYGAEFQSRFHRHLESLDIRHVYIRPRTPHLNGKVERSHRVDDQEFYQLLDQDGISDDIHLFNEKLREWE